MTAIRRWEELGQSIELGYVVSGAVGSAESAHPVWPRVYSGYFQGLLCLDVELQWRRKNKVISRRLDARVRFGHLLQSHCLLPSRSKELHAVRRFEDAPGPWLSLALFPRACSGGF